MIRLCALVLALVTGVFAAAPARAEWLEASNSHFVIYGDLKREEMQRFADRLERFDAALRVGLNLKDAITVPSNRVVVYVVRNQGVIQELGRSSSVAGFYMARVEGPVAFTPRKTDSDDKYFNPELVLFHEYVHHLMLNNSNAYYPGWVTEGMAEFFAVARMEANGDVTTGLPNNARGYSIFSESVVSINDLLNADANRGRGVDGDQLYARGWLLIHYLLLGGKRDGQFTRYMELINARKAPLEAATQAFGKLSTLDRELNDYRMKPLKSVTIRAADLKPVPVAIRPLDAAEAQMMPLRLRSTAGVDEKGAKALVAPARKIAASYPNHAWVQRVLAEIEFDAGNDTEAGAAADRALAVEPSNVMALIYKGLLEQRRAAAAKPSNPDYWKAARRWFMKANRADPDYAYPFTLFYGSFAGAGETPNASAIAGLERAVELAPQVDALRMMLAFERLRSGDLAAMRVALLPVSADPHGGGDNLATKLIALIDQGADVAAVRAELAKR
ncbi:DUF1570 domain-containing protein, partial [Sphingomonas sp.]|uniref:DUF1570 domain-containing protein n=1 Tax=Sphingomonas sp. TaxID=28214 RepID=UPI001D460C45